MTREEILDMPAGREMDALIVEKIFGLVENPNNTAPTSETWFWIHPKDGVLIGIPFDVGGKIENTEIYDHQWERFCQSTDIADAWAVVEEMKSKHFRIYYKSVPFQKDDKEPIGWMCSMSGFGFMSEHADTAPLAICRAALLAVMEAE